MLSWIERAIRKKVNLKKDLRQRSAGVLVALFILGFVVGALRLGYLQIYKGDEYRRLAERQQLGDSTIAARRGTIYDRNMHALAESSMAWKVFIDPMSMKENIDNRKNMADKTKEKLLEDTRKTLSEGLAELLDLDKDELYEKAGNFDNGYIVIKQQVDLQLKNSVEEFGRKNDLSAYIGIEQDSKRYYPYENLASTVLGFAENGSVATVGVESYYDEELSGVAGRQITKSSANRDLPIENVVSHEVSDGVSLVLTIDDNIQSLLETELKKAYERSNASAAYGIVQHVKTGAILAMSDQPDYNTNDPYVVTDEGLLKTVEEEEKKLEEQETETAAATESATGEEDKEATTDTETEVDKEDPNKLTPLQEARQSQWKNRTISETYEPGSVFKCITLASALEEGVVDENTTYFCGGGIQVAENFIKCHNRSGHGYQTLEQGLMNSCNPFFITVGQRLGIEKFYNYFQAFGFTDKTNIDLAGEARPTAGIQYHRRGEFALPQLSSYAFGQTFEVTPIQMVTAIACIANGGKLMQPYVVAKELDPDGNVIKETQPVCKRQVISERTSRRVLDMMESVVSDGTGKNGRVDGYNVAGKTGTSEKLSRRQEGKYYVASFACVAPGDDPEIAVLIAIDEPKGDVNGGSIAAPVASAVVEGTMDILNIEPSYAKDDKEASDVSVPNLTNMTIYEADAAARESGLTVKILGSGSTVLRQVPSLGQTLPSYGTIVVYTDEEDQGLATVPDFNGLTVYAARQLAATAGITIKPKGNFSSSGDVVAFSQDIAAESEVAYGTVVKVQFKSYSGVRDSILG